MRVFKSDLSVSGINNLIKDLTDYKDSLEDKNRIFMEKLAEKGIKVCHDEQAQGDSHDFFSMVTFEMKWEDKTLCIIGRNSDLSRLHTLWYDGQGNEHRETINPILALEYGTAGLAIKGHKGSAAVTGNHVDDTEWYYYSELTSNGKPTELKYATAEEAHQPMYQAWFNMKMEIVKTAKEVFGK